MKKREDEDRRKMKSEDVERRRIKSKDEQKDEKGGCGERMKVRIRRRNKREDVVTD